MRILKIAYDCVRGGFEFSVGTPNRLSFSNILDNQYYSIYPDINGRILSFMSFRVPVAGLYLRDFPMYRPEGSSREYPQLAKGIYPLPTDGSHCGPKALKVLNESTHIDFRFGCSPPETAHYALGESLLIWLAAGKLVRVRFAYAALAVDGRIEALEFLPEDFK